jgi:hypothetical protein
MEGNREVTKLTNVLRRIARAAWYAAWRNPEPDAARFCAAQYNRVRARLEALEPAVTPLFAPLPESASPQLIRMAAVELAAFFDEEGAGERGERHEHRGHRRHGCRKRAWVGVVRC